ncbi:NADPH-dependent FMN reductase [Hydrogenovibrio kuenenii]|uniref:NADPH-dependent FMN reductase n=1 Tax=Hydrogenovibrio kuenenii TaxID=63658 RepID=UPI000464726B|nr:NAD(P)H-dependent oxidoreductase [Hydrogenovibrio kuenenii]
MEDLKILGLCGSLRKKSTNMGLLRYAKEHLPEGMTLEIADLSHVPFYNEDIKDKPPAVEMLFQQMSEADGFLFACPEYNYSIAPALKNAIDWASREPNNLLLSDKPAAIMGSGGGMGTSRAQYHLRQVCVFVNLHVLNRPEVFCNAFADTFNEKSELVDTRIQQLIEQQLMALKAFAQKWQRDSSN